MRRHTIHLEHHYQELTEEITNNTRDYPEDFYEVHGERFNHHQLLSEIISKLTGCDQARGVISIASYLTEFELERFRAINYDCIPDMPNCFNGEILYASDDIALCRIKSIRYLGFGLVILVTKQHYSFDFDSNTGFVLGHHYRLDGVLSL